jgi:hypothetical protein
MNQAFLRTDSPDFSDLPWQVPLSEWQPVCMRVEQVQRGLSRHPVIFVNYSGVLYAIKELPPGLAKQEFDLLSYMEKARLPTVIPIGYTEMELPRGNSSFLFTQFLESSIPYRTLFMRSNLKRYHHSLLDAMAGLLVQLHLAGIYWGDCSLSNTLFRRDAGALQAYLVDAETAEIHAARLSPIMRHHDLEIMQENIEGDLVDLASLDYLPPDFPAAETGAYILERYRQLWEQISSDMVINLDERYRIQERIRALNNLGFSVCEVELQDSSQGDKLKLHISVTDRHFHRDQLYELTGIIAGEHQARQIINEINELKAYLSQVNNRSVPLSATAYYWLENYYQPVLRKLQRITYSDHSEAPTEPTELYCQVLEHKWFLSERAQRDVGHDAAVEDYIRRFGE